ncbi:MAG: ATP-binding cassette domain-containing protein [Deltaproteobacteria bacterium]|nr:ATP-binding cassette domain-containing protein [Deltaproteobacteria bacterium]
MDALIVLDNVAKRFDGHAVLDGLSLEIRPGETMTIIGGSGTGKSVTLKLILGLMRPDRGRIYFRGSDVTRMTEGSLVAMRREMGMLFQGGALFDSLTVGENIAYPLREHFREMTDGEREGRVASSLSLVGLPETEAMMPADLSGGMKKRVALARAIATNPAVILYDEPTTGLDPANCQRINRLIRECQRKLRVTSVIVTHDLESAFLVTDRIALLYNRRIEFVGTVAEAKASANAVVGNFIEGNLE